MILARTRPTGPTDDDERDVRAVMTRQGKTMQHELKTWPEYFEPIRLGVKTFEIRIDDRGYQAGDDLVLREYFPHGTCEACPDHRHRDRACQRYSGRVITARVGYVMSSTPERAPGRQGFQGRGYVVLALVNVEGIETSLDRRTLRYAAIVAAERDRVRQGPFGPDHDRDHGGTGHLAEQVFERLQLARDGQADKTDTWVHVGQFALAALELLDVEPIQIIEPVPDLEVMDSYRPEMRDAIARVHQASVPKAGG